MVPTIQTIAAKAPDLFTVTSTLIQIVKLTTITTAGEVARVICLFNPDQIDRFLF
jgi:hypothetical protein